MRVWVLTNEYAGNNVGGLGVVATHLSRALANCKETDVTVICKDGRRRTVTVENNESITVVRFPRNSNYHSNAKQIFQVQPIARWMRKHGYEQPDIIHIHSLQYDNLARYYKRKYKIPVVYTCHSLIILEPNKLKIKKMEMRQRKLIRLANAVTVPSSWQKNMIKRVYSFYKKSMIVIPNGVVATEGVKVSPTNPNRLLYVGRLNVIKGIEELLRAVSLLKKNNPKVKLDIVGKGSIAYMARLKQLAKQLSISSNINWLGKIRPSKVQQMYRSYGAVVVTSRHESFGLVALEALAHGVPLVSTRNGGLRGFVNKSNATVIPCVEAASIAAGIRRMWSSPRLTTKRANKGLDTARRHDWPSISNRYRALFANFVT